MDTEKTYTSCVRINLLNCTLDQLKRKGADLPQIFKSYGCTDIWIAEGTVTATAACRSNEGPTNQTLRVSSFTRESDQNSYCSTTKNVLNSLKECSPEIPPRVNKSDTDIITENDESSSQCSFRNLTELTCCDKKNVRIYPSAKLTEDFAASDGTHNNIDQETHLQSSTSEDCGRNDVIREIEQSNIFLQRRASVVTTQSTKAVGSVNVVGESSEFVRFPDQIGETVAIPHCSTPINPISSVPGFSNFASTPFSRISKNETDLMLRNQSESTSLVIQRDFREMKIGEFATLATHTVKREVYQKGQLSSSNAGERMEADNQIENDRDVNTADVRQLSVQFPKRSTSLMRLREVASRRSLHKLSVPKDNGPHCKIGEVDPIPVCSTPKDTSNLDDFDLYYDSNYSPIHKNYSEAIYQIKPDWPLPYPSPRMSEIQQQEVLETINEESICQSIDELIGNNSMEEVTAEEAPHFEQPPKSIGTFTERVGKLKKGRAMKRQSSAGQLVGRRSSVIFERVGSPYNERSNEVVKIECFFDGCKTCVNWKRKFGKVRLLDHALLFHSDQKNIKCNICNYEAKTYRAMSYHYKSYHPEDKLKGYGPSNIDTSSNELKALWEKCYGPHLHQIGHLKVIKNVENVAQRRKYTRKTRK